MSTLLASIGEQPTAVTPLIDHLSLEEGLHEVVLLATSKPSVLLSAKVIEWEYKKDLHCRTRVFPFEDVRSDQDVAELMKGARDELIALRGQKKVFIGISGGRKDISVALGLIGSMFGAYRMFHVITEEISSINTEWYSISRQLEQNFDHFTETHKEKLRSLIHPPKGKVSIISIPFLPSMIQTATRILISLEQPRKASDFDFDVLNSLIAIGAVEGERKIRITEYGRLLREVFE